MPSDIVKLLQSFLVPSLSLSIEWEPFRYSQVAQVARDLGNLVAAKFLLRCGFDMHDSEFFVGAGKFFAVARLMQQSVFECFKVGSMCQGYGWLQSLSCSSNEPHLSAYFPSRISQTEDPEPETTCVCPALFPRVSR